MVLKTGEPNNDDNFSASTEKHKRLKPRPTVGGKEPRSSIVTKMDTVDRMRLQKQTKKQFKRYPKDIHAKYHKRNNGPTTSYHGISQRSNSFSSSSLTNSSPDTSIVEHQKRKIQELEQVIQAMKYKKKKKKNLQDTEISPQFEWNVKLIVKDFIFPKLKFITSEKTLQDFRKKSSVGYAFLKHYKDMYVQTNHVIDDDLSDEEIWNNAKNIVHKTIKQKRGTVQSELKKAWKGKTNI